MSKKVLVILSGCGVYDGSEIHEAVITLVALSDAGASVTCAAPNKDQMHVINHASGAEMSETRNVMIESARISRGNIADLSTVNPDDFDAVFLPGGFGAAKNLCTFATEGSDCSIDGDTQRILKAFHAAGKGRIGRHRGIRIRNEHVGVVISVGQRRRPSVKRAREPSRSNGKARRRIFT